MRVHAACEIISKIAIAVMFSFASDDNRDLPHAAILPFGLLMKPPRSGSTHPPPLTRTDRAPAHPNDGKPRATSRATSEHREVKALKAAGALF